MSSLRLAPGVRVAVIATVITLLPVGCGDSGGGDRSTTTVRPAARGPVAVRLDELQDFAGSVGHPVYWAGQRPGGYELTVDSGGNVFIRYLEGRVQVGSRRQTSLTVATYPFPNAYRKLQAVSRRSGEGFVQTPDGGLVVTDTGSPDNVHIAYPGRDIQIEVYDPHAGRSLQLSRAGRIVPVP
jgi:hypothetical protein